MASVEECEAALRTLAGLLAGVEQDLRDRHVPRRTVACRVSDLDVTFVGRLDEHGLHDLERCDDEPPATDVRVTTRSDDLVDLAERRTDFLHAWLRGRVHVSAGVRDLLRLRTLLGL